MAGKVRETAGNGGKRREMAERCGKRRETAASSLGGDLDDNDGSDKSWWL